MCMFLSEERHMKQSIGYLLFVMLAIVSISTSVAYCQESPVVKITNDATAEANSFAKTNLQIHPFKRFQNKRLAEPGIALVSERPKPLGFPRRPASENSWH